MLKFAISALRNPSRKTSSFKVEGMSLKFSKFFKKYSHLSNWGFILGIFFSLKKKSQVVFGERIQDSYLLAMLSFVYFL